MSGPTEPSPQPCAKALRVVGLGPHLQGVARYARTSPPSPKAGQVWDKVTLCDNPDAMYMPPSGFLHWGHTLLPPRLVLAASL
eukprot:365999-Chlamydomonas_euryale.AAC.9